MKSYPSFMRHYPNYFRNQFHFFNSHEWLAQGYLYLNANQISQYRSYSRFTSTAQHSIYIWCYCFISHLFSQAIHLLFIWLLLFGLRRTKFQQLCLPTRLSYPWVPSFNFGVDVRLPSIESAFAKIEGIARIAKY